MQNKFKQLPKKTDVALRPTTSISLPRRQRTAKESSHGLTKSLLLGFALSLTNLACGGESATPCQDPTAAGEQCPSGCESESGNAVDMTAHCLKSLEVIRCNEEKADLRPGVGACYVRKRDGVMFSVSYPFAFAYKEGWRDCDNAEREFCFTAHPCGETATCRNTPVGWPGEVLVFRTFS